VLFRWKWWNKAPCELCLSQWGVWTRADYEHLNKVIDLQTSILLSTCLQVHMWDCLKNWAFTFQSASTWRRLTSLQWWVKANLLYLVKVNLPVYLGRRLQNFLSILQYCSLDVTVFWIKTLFYIVRSNSQSVVIVSDLVQAFRVISSDCVSVYLLTCSWENFCAVYCCLYQDFM
jgi:hypothetical protein